MGRILGPDGNPFESGVQVRGLFRGRCLERSRRKAHRWRVVWEDVAENQSTGPALDNLLNAGIRFQANLASAWYMGLVDFAGWSQFQTTDTMAAHVGWVECVAYSQAQRPVWAPGASSAQAVTNAVALNFTFNAAATIKGPFICSDPVKGGASGLLLATAPWSQGNQSLQSSQVFQGTYSFYLTAL